MNRGVIVGGGLIAASFLVAIVLNRSAHEEVAPAKAVQPVTPVTRVCAELAQRAPTATPARGGDEEKCVPSAADPASR